MNLKCLSTKTMRLHSNVWLHDSDLRPAVDSNELGRALLSEVDVAHRALASTDEERTELEELIEALTLEGIDVDNVHDRAARCLYGVLSGIAEIAPPADAKRLLSLRDRLFPDRLEVINHSYSDEASATLRASELLSADDRILLSSQGAGTGTLADVFDRWISAGQRLGEIVRAREIAKASIAENGKALVPVDRNRARHEWIRAARMFINALDRIGLSDDLRRAIMAPLRRDITVASRVRGDKSETPDADTGADADTDTDTDTIADADTDTDTDTDTDAAADADADAAADADADAAADADADAAAVTQIRG